MTVVRVSCVAWALLLGWNTPLRAQFPDGAVRLVDVSGQTTRVLTLALERRVEGSPILFLHAGGGVTLETWAPWLIALSKIAPVVAYDRIGIGGSPFDNQAPTFDRTVAHAQELLATLNVPPPYVLVGHSIGGVIIFKYATRYPGEVTGLVYLDPTPLRLSPHEWVQAENDSVMATRWRELRAFSETFAAPGLLAWERMVDDFLQSPVAERDLPPDPDIPTAVVLGARAVDDDDTSWWNAEFVRAAKARGLVNWGKLLDGLSHGTLIAAYDAGHFVFRDAPGLALEAVRTVLSVRGGK